ncbi:MAG TPA: wax ester/triacylglycerol synthase family O-acyltransferase [Dehalococcoidia bacterium]|nr:wax ester/triacylglycerol synthase family O-acyltransferase [Dehalococcoidia bacterium]
MTQRGRSERLSAQDASFLYFETKEAPLHIGSIALLDGQVQFDDFVENIRSKLHLIPRYQQLVVPAPFNIGHPTWEWDPDFDLSRHIFEVEKRGAGTDEDLHQQAADLFAPMLARDKPLWEIYIIRNLKGDRSALVSRVHHCLVDGVSGIELLMIMLDVSQTPIPPAPAPEIEKLPPDPLVTRFFDAILDNVAADIDRFASRAQLRVNVAGGDTQIRSIGRALETAVPYFQVPVARAPFNKPFSGGRKVAFSEFSFAEIRQIRQQVGGTVNDVVLTVLGGALGRYLEMHGQSTEGRSARVLTPVNVRKDDEKGALGNRVSMLLIEVPVGIADPLDRLRTISARTDALKRQHVADGIESLSTVLGGTPPILQAAMGRLPTPRNTVANMVCTNVPGPMIPLYCVGRRLLGHYPMIPLGWEMGISLGVTSYDQKLYFGYMADADAGKDVHFLKDFTDQAYVELRSAAEVAKSDLPQVGIPVKPATTRRSAAAAPQALAADAG